MKSVSSVLCVRPSNAIPQFELATVISMAVLKLAAMATLLIDWPSLDTEAPSPIRNHLSTGGSLAS